MNRNNSISADRNAFKNKNVYFTLQWVNNLTDEKHRKLPQRNPQMIRGWKPQRFQVLLISTTWGITFEFPLNKTKQYCFPANTQFSSSRTWDKNYSEKSAAKFGWMCKPTSMIVNPLSKDTEQISRKLRLLSPERESLSYVGDGWLNSRADIASTDVTTAEYPSQTVCMWYVK